MAGDPFIFVWLLGQNAIAGGLVGIGDNGERDEAEAERNVDRALHIGGGLGVVFHDLQRCTIAQ
jgi:hypothetical protein